MPMGRKEFNEQMKELMHLKQKVEKLNGNNRLFYIMSKPAYLRYLEQQIHNLRKGAHTDLINLAW